MSLPPSLSIFRPNRGRFLDLLNKWHLLINPVIGRVKYFEWPQSLLVDDDRWLPPCKLGAHFVRQRLTDSVSELIA